MEQVVAISRSERLKRKKEYRASNKEKIVAYRREYYAKNKEPEAENNRRWVKNNPEKVKASKKRDYEKNKEKYLKYAKQLAKDKPEINRKASAKYRKNNKDACNKRIREWAANNPDKNSAKEAKRRTVKMNAMPAWADENRINDKYRDAKEMTAGGVEHHVDHIIPLQGKLVCGLHVAGNLQVIPAMENYIKSNKFVVVL